MPFAANRVELNCKAARYDGRSDSFALLQLMSIVAFSNAGQKGLFLSVILLVQTGGKPESGTRLAGRVRQSPLDVFGHVLPRARYALAPAEETRIGRSMHKGGSAKAPGVKGTVFPN